MFLLVFCFVFKAFERLATEIVE